MSCLTILTAIISAILIVTLFITNYIGFVIFLCCSVQIVISYFVSFAVWLISKYVRNTIISLLWISFSIPFVHLLLGINFKIINSYFKNIWKVLCFEGIKNTIRSDFENNKCSIIFIICKYITILLLILFLAVFMIIEIISHNENVIISVIIGIISVIPLVISFFKVAFMSIKSLFMEPTEVENDENSEETTNETDDDESSDSQHQVRLATNDNNNNTNVEKKEIKQSLLDPCGIIDQVDYFNFLNDPKVNHFASFFKLKRFNVKMIPGFVSLFLVVLYIGFDLFIFIYYKNYKLYYQCIIYPIRILIYIFCIPFVMIFNFTGLFFERKRTKEKHPFIRKMWILVSFIYLILILNAIVIIPIIHFKFQPFFPKNLVYKNDFPPIKTSRPVSMCETKYNGLDLLQYAGIALLSQSLDDDLISAINKYFNIDYQLIDVYGNPFIYFLDVKINETFSVISFKPIVSLNDVSFFIENFFNDFMANKMFSAIIPFYDLTNNLLLSKFMNLLSQRLSFIVGIPRISADYIELTGQAYDIVSSQNITTVYTGFSVGGLLAKGIGSYFNVPSVSFESLNYYHSVYGAAISLFYDEIKFVTNGFEMINLYSPSQLFAQEEANATMNIKFPKWKGLFDYINPYEAVCLIAAGCAVDERYDGFCDSIIGMDQYKYLFSIWNRTRSDMI